MAVISIRNIVIVGVLGAIAYTAATHLLPGGGGGWGHMGPAPVSVAVVEEHSVREWHDFSGRLVAVDQADIRPRVSGTITKIHFKDGAMVDKGDVLFTIDPRPYEAAYEAANARARLTEGEMNRAKRLLAEKAISQREYDQRKSDYAVAKADQTRAKLNLDYCYVQAPISGRVSRAEVTVGNLLDAGGNAPILTSVVSTSPIYADFEIDEATFLQYAHAGIAGNQDADKVPVELTLTGQESTPHKGHIDSFDNRLNTASGTIRVRAIFDNKDNRLIPGFFARIRLGGADENKQLLVTERAIGTDQNKKFLLVVGDDNKVQYREIKLDGTANGMRIVADGVKAGEKIVVNGLQRARPGSEVIPQVVPMDAPDTETGPPGAPPGGDAKKPEEPKAAESAPESPAADKPAESSDTPKQGGA